MFEDQAVVEVALTEEEACEYARLELASEANVAITGLTGAAALEYIELTASQAKRLTYLGGCHRLWEEDITPSNYVDNEFEEADRLARLAGYTDCRAMAAALKPGYLAAEQEEADRRWALREKRSAAAKRAAATRRANREAQARVNRLEREAQAEERKRIVDRIESDPEYQARVERQAYRGPSAPATQEEEERIAALIAKTPAPANGVHHIELEVKTPAPAPGEATGFEVSYNHSYHGATYEEAYYRVVIAQLRLARAFELTAQDDWWGNDTTILDTAIAIWEERLRRATEQAGSPEERHYQFRRAAVAAEVNREYPDLAATVRSMVASRETPASILLWFVGSRWAGSLTVQAVILLIDRIWE